jgi:hypothetical protein
LTTGQGAADGWTVLQASKSRHILHDMNDRLHPSRVAQAALPGSDAGDRAMLHGNCAVEAR